MAPKKKSVADYRNENAVLRSRLRDLEENFTTQSAGYAAAVKKLDEAEQRLAQVEAKFKVSANTAEHYLEISNGREKKIAELRHELAEARDVIRHLKEGQEQMSRAINDMHDQNDDLHRRAEAARNERDKVAAAREAALEAVYRLGVGLGEK